MSVPRPVRLGLLGGTFDPPHIGHLVAALEAKDQLGLDRVLLVVANEPWQKVGEREISPAATRLELVEAAVAAPPGLDASAIEIDRGGPSYTADTIEELRKVDAQAELVVILGCDAAALLPTWQRAEVVRRETSVAVVDRPGCDAALLPAGWDLVPVTMPAFGISSTEVRARVRDGRPIDFLVPAGVAAVIDRLGLYRGGRHD